MSKFSPWHEQPFVIAPHNPTEDLWMEDDWPDDSYDDDLTEGKIDDVFKLNDM